MKKRPRKTDGRKKDQREREKRQRGNKITLPT